MKLKPWYDVVKPREDLKESKPLDASEFAVNLEKVRLGNKEISKDYTDPKRFFDRTFLTDNLLKMSSEVVRRLSGITTESSAVFNTMTQFGGGKTHALTLVYHLAKAGHAASKLRGAQKILDRAQVTSFPDDVAVAVFVGNEFDSLTGRGGDDGTPLRKTPWGEIAFQLGGKASFQHVAQHDAEFTDPKGDVIDRMLPKDRPCLILMDEVLSFFSTYRDRGYGTKLYNFIQALSETVRGRKNTVLIVSAPKSDFDYSYTADDVSDLQRLEHMLERLSKTIVLSAESDASEIIRRRLFEWDDTAVSADGRVLLPEEAHATCKAYGDWIQDHRLQLPDLINADLAREQFLQSYPFHPMTISVFERKWAALPRFQRTRGILRVLALWVSNGYQAGYKGVHRDPLITPGTAPMEDPMFRPAIFEQLGEPKLETAVTTDIAGTKSAHAVRLDAEAPETIKKERLHKKVACTIFLESNGGQVGKEAKEASLPEIRLAVGGPDIDLGNVETVLDALYEACYFLTVENNRYHFSLKENLNKRFSDRRATVRKDDVDELIKANIQKIFKGREKIDVVFFPTETNQVSDRPALTLVVGGLEQTMDDAALASATIEHFIKECGNSSRTYKSAQLWIVAESASSLRDDARKLLAWQSIQDEATDLKLDEQQVRQVRENVQRADRDLKESIWRSYKNLMLLAKDGSLKREDLGLPNSSSSTSPIELIKNHLMKNDDLATSVSSGTLTRSWPPAFIEWNTKSVRDAFFASPLFPRILDAEALKEGISRGVTDGRLGYVAKDGDGRYSTFVYGQQMSPFEVEISEDVFIIKKEAAEKYKAAQEASKSAGTPQPVAPGGGSGAVPPPVIPVPPIHIQAEFFSDATWTGDVPATKWVNFYSKVVTKLGATQGVKLTVKLEVRPDSGISKQKLDEARIALHELGLNPEILATPSLTSKIRP